MNLLHKSAASVFRYLAKMSNVEVLRFKVKKQSWEDVLSTNRFLRCKRYTIIMYVADVQPLFTQHMTHNFYIIRELLLTCSKHRGLLRFIFIPRLTTLKTTWEESQMSNFHTTLFQISFVLVMIRVGPS